MAKRRTQDLTLVDVFRVRDVEAAGSSVFTAKDLKDLSVKVSGHGESVGPEEMKALAAPALSRVLDISVLDILIGGWTKLRVLRELASPENRKSSRTHKVPLVGHTIKSVHSPVVELAFNGVPIAETAVDLSVGMSLKGATLLVQRGRIKAMKIAGCRAEGSVSVRGHTLLQRKSKPLALPGKIEFGQGIPIPGSSAKPN
ncbi:MAG: hypothetical protein AAFX52_14575 [Pseudomonadota bacterium]